MDSYWQGIYSQTSKLQSLSTLSFQVDIHKIQINHKNTEIAPIIYPPSNIEINQLKPDIFLWEVTENINVNLKDIQTAPNVYGYASDIFIVGGIKWYLTFYPNGSKIARAGYPNVYLHLAALPEIDMKVNIRHSQGLNGDYKMRDAQFVTVFY